MSLVMDPPVNMRKSLEAAKRSVAKATGGGGDKSKSKSAKGRSASSSSPSFSVLSLGVDAATATVCASLAWLIGFCTTGTTAALLGVALVVVFQSGMYANPVGKGLAFIQTTVGQESKRKINVDQWITGYNDLHHKDSDYVTDGDKAGVEQRNSSYTTLVNAYYELATLFYEIGWGTSFHFATRRKRETFTESIKRHEYYLASKLGGDLTNKKLVDVGCGVGGPYRNISTFTGADVTGITLNEYQVQRGNKLCMDDGLLQQCRSVQGDFMKMPFADGSFDGGYAIEATCHAPSREKVYAEILRVLKPGAMFAMYEWCLTPEYDPNNEEHRVIKKQIEEGDGLPDMARTWEIDEAVKAAGFELLESRDVVLDTMPGDTPWYHPLTPSWNIFTQRFQFTKLGMFLTCNGLKLLEGIKLAPAGTCKVQKMLLQGGIGCVRGGETGIFTPMYLCVMRKPLTAKK